LSSRERHDGLATQRATTAKSSGRALRKAVAANAMEAIKPS
jgi:hypothetical protein